jgi:hypothetical protein
MLAPPEYNPYVRSVFSWPTMSQQHPATRVITLWRGGGSWHVRLRQEATSAARTGAVSVVSDQHLEVCRRVSSRHSIKETTTNVKEMRTVSRARIITPEAHHGRFRTVLDLGSAEHPDYPPSLRQHPHQLNKQQFATGVAA